MLVQGITSLVHNFAYLGYVVHLHLTFQIFTTSLSLFDQRAINLIEHRYIVEDFSKYFLWYKGLLISSSFNIHAKIAERQYSPKDEIHKGQNTGKEVMGYPV